MTVSNLLWLHLTGRKLSNRFRHVISLGVKQKHMMLIRSERDLVPEYLCAKGQNKRDVRMSRMYMYMYCSVSRGRLNKTVHMKNKEEVATENPGTASESSMIKKDKKLGHQGRPVRLPCWTPVPVSNLARREANGTRPCQVRLVGRRECTRQQISGEPTGQTAHSPRPRHHPH